MTGAPEFEIKTNLRAVLAQLKEFDPKLATEIRKELRHSADDAKKAMQDILAEPSPGMVTGWTYRSGGDSRGRKRNHLRDAPITAPAARSQSTGARQAVARSIRLKVSTTKTNESIRLSSTGAPLSMIYNKKSWRHPVFGDRKVFVEQAGTGYFNRGAFGQRDAMQARAQNALAKAIAAIQDHNLPVE